MTNPDTRPKNTAALPSPPAPAQVVIDHETFDIVGCDDILFAAPGIVAVEYKMVDRYLVLAAVHRDPDVAETKEAELARHVATGRVWPLTGSLAVQSSSTTEPLRLLFSSGRLFSMTPLEMAAQAAG